MPSNQTTQRLDGIIFTKASIDKNTQRRIKHEPRTPLLHTIVATFVLMSLTYNTYFRNIKRKSEVTFLS